jgi:hypothetical protein
MRLSTQLRGEHPITVHDPIRIGTLNSILDLAAAEPEMSVTVTSGSRFSVVVAEFAQCDTILQHVTLLRMSHGDILGGLAVNALRRGSYSRSPASRGAGAREARMMGRQRATYDAASASGPGDESIRVGGLVKFCRRVAA